MKIKTLTMKELVTKKPAEIEKYVTELTKTQAELNHALRTGKEKQTHQMKLVKKAIARAKTVQSAQTGEEK